MKQILRNTFAIKVFRAGLALVLLIWVGSDGYGQKNADNSVMNNSRLVIAVPSLHQNADVYIHIGSGWMLKDKYRYRYNSQGKVTSWIQSNPSNQPQIKDSTNYNSAGQVVFSAKYVWMNNSWVLFVSSQTIRTYNTAGKETETIYQTWSNNAWQNSSKVVRTFNAFNFPVEETFYSWINNSWAPDAKNVFSYTNAANPPTTITKQVNGAGTWIDQERQLNIVWHSFADTLMSAYEKQYWTNGNWENNTKAAIVYDAFGGSVKIEQGWDIGIWKNANRITETFDSKRNFIGSMVESWTNNAWVKVNETAEVLTYNAADQITERIFRSYNTTTQTLEDTQKIVYFNFLILGTGKNLATSNLKVYPNPATDFILIELKDGTESKASVTDLTGRVVLKLNLKSARYHRLDLTSLPKGSYLLKLQNKNGAEIYKILKQ